MTGGWEEVLAMAPGHIAASYEVDGLPVMIRRGHGSLCAYVGVPKDSLLAGLDYDALDIKCHGGLTFAKEGDGDWPKTYYWFGWDYCHWGDAMTFDAVRAFHRDFGEHRWTVEEVKAEIPQVVAQFKRLLEGGRT